MFVHTQRFEGEAPLVRLALPGYPGPDGLSGGVVTGACSSTGLSDYGLAALNTQVGGGIPEAQDLVRVLSVVCLTELGLRVGCDSWDCQWLGT